MSGICGVYHYGDSSPVDKELLLRMRDAASGRGPDGAGHYLKENIGLGHRLLRTTPESAEEQQPASNHHGLWIVADARIDNRAELDAIFSSQSDWPPTDRSKLPDVAYILRAYETWGGEAPLHLLGDFAFAIWDKPRQTLFCARDPIGLKPFVYHQDHKRFLFGSEIRQILQDPAVPRDPNLAHLGEILIISFSNREESPYLAIRRLPPGHLIRSRRGLFEIKPYWSWNPDKEPVSRASLEDNAERFRAIFEEAVRCRLRVPVNYRVGSLLSGGLDSSSVVSAAASLLGPGISFPVFNLNFKRYNPAMRLKNTDGVDENLYFNSVVQAWNLEPHRLEIDGQGPLDDLSKLFSIHKSPLFFPNLAYFHRLFELAPALNTRVMLHGDGGDEMFFPGPYCSARDFWKGHFFRFFRDCAGRHRLRGTPYASMLMSLIRAFPPARLKKFLRHFKKTIPGLISPAFSTRVDLERRSKFDCRWDPSFHTASRSYATHVWLQSNLALLAIEALDRSAAANQIEIRTPFFDLRVMKFMAGIPWYQKTFEGTKKVLLREAMRKILPSQVCKRMQKAEFGPGIIEALRRHADPALRACFSEPHPLLAEMTNPLEVKKLYEKFFSPTVVTREWNSAQSFWHLWYVVSVDQWARYEQISHKKT